jgi:hypothetical protein
MSLSNERNVTRRFPNDIAYRTMTRGGFLNDNRNGTRWHATDIGMPVVSQVET